MIALVTTVHVTCCLFLVLLVLIQSGKGAEISASFSGSSQTVFGSSGAANVFQKATGIFAAIFFCTSVFLTVHGSGQNRTSVFDSKLPASQQTTTAPGTTTAPAAPAQGTAPAAPAAQK